MFKVQGYCLPHFLQTWEEQRASRTCEWEPDEIHPWVCAAIQAELTTESPRFEPIMQFLRLSESQLDDIWYNLHDM